MSMYLADAFKYKYVQWPKAEDMAVDVSVNGV